MQTDITHLALPKAFLWGPNVLVFKFYELFKNKNFFFCKSFAIPMATRATCKPGSICILDNDQHIKVLFVENMY